MKAQELRITGEHFQEDGRTVGALNQDLGQDRRSRCGGSVVGVLFTLFQSAEKDFVAHFLLSSHEPHQNFF